MNAKGTAIKITQDFIKEKFPDKYEEWLNKLPEESKKIFENPILSGSWYPVYEGFVIPTKIAGEMFFDSAEEAAFEIGKYSANKTLHGIYRFFLKIPSFSFVMKRATLIFETFYDEGKIQVINSSDKHITIKLSELKIDSTIFYNRILGWIIELLNIINKNPQEWKTKIERDSNFITVYFSINF